MGMLSLNAKSALVFFASPNATKLEYLEKVQWPESFLLNENGTTTNIPLVAITYRFAELIDHDIAAEFEIITKHDGSLYHELRALVELIIARKDEYSYMWYLDKDVAGVSGFADHLWSVVARLAKAVLCALAIEPTLLLVDIGNLVPSVRLPESHPSPILRRKKRRS